MIINNICLQPFAGVIHREFEFSPGMNVVLGPNEAGKSTLVNALISILFQSTNYGKIHWKKELDQFVPRGGGDTFRVSLKCESEGVLYKISKSWGAENRGELILPSGQTVTSAEEIDRKIAQILNLKQGTWQNILISRQSVLSATLNDFNSKGTEAADLAQLLRKAAFDTDGVSIEQLECKIRESLTAVTSRWDIVADSPEKGRGIENPWKSQGTLLAAWYKHQQLLADRKAVEKYEHERDNVNAEISRLTEERDRLAEFVGKHRPIIEAAEKRARLANELDKAKSREQELKDIQTTWPKDKLELQRLQTLRPQLDESFAAVEKELQDALSYEKTQSQRNTLTRAYEEQKHLRELEEQNGKFAHLSECLFSDLEGKLNQRDQLAASVAAGKLLLRCTSAIPLEVDVESGLKEPEKRTINTSEPLIINADGRIVLKTADWSIEVESGDGGFLTVQQNFECRRNEITDLLKQIGAATIEDARNLKREFNSARHLWSNQKQKLANILNGKTIEGLQAEAGATTAQPERSFEQINHDRDKIRADQKDAETSFKELTKKIEEWKVQFISPEAMLDTILDARDAKRKLESQLHDLPSVPDDIVDFESFLESFKSQDQRLQVIKEMHLPDAKATQARLFATEPDRSTHELEELIADASLALESERRRLRSLQRVSDVFQQLKTDLDSGTLDPWMARLKQTVGKLTADRYHQVNVDQRSVDRIPGVELSHDLLSMGTKSSIGLAVRLSMASHFLEGLHGFLVLDDPMVDLDPERQLVTAAVLKEFAVDKQVIVFTCHPGHAKLLSDSPITLERLA
jgi:exonuclease SbcC